MNLFGLIIITLRRSFLHVLFGKTSEAILIKCVGKILYGTQIAFLNTLLSCGWLLNQNCELKTNWPNGRNYVCSLCNKKADSHDHMFFKCDFANDIWKKVCGIAK